MEKWQQDFENYMLNVGDREEVMFAVAIGKKDKAVADAIIEYVEKNNLDAHDILENDDKFDKHQDFLEFCINLRKSKN